jgi:hypothetical protein
LLKYGEKADSVETRQLLVQAYKKEGKALFERSPASLVLTSGLSAAMLLGAHNVTKPLGEGVGEAAKDMGEGLAKNPEALSTVAKHGISVVVASATLLAILVLWWFKMLPWNVKSAARPVKVENRAREIRSG